ncbi:Uncharacterised protein [Mycobacterium tuberculosis]|uniref:Uncharacterized protein n=1 Tax=Mycobacterium tuberculosis TaxID=1773 RepID=A0A655E4V7_MYCTX|nr:Uncharacterised protein [Mycobacterium tuberculosis]SGF32771.1 Uncharacterised protein [Mycobacterium tuberculosis]SGK53153.1 Uncharacterised protein [Mycobacterium tuberculosis]
MLDATNLGGILEGVRLDRDGKGFARMSGIETHGHRATRTNAVDAAGRPLDVGRVNIAPGHDDDILDAATYHHVALLGEVAEVARVVPAMLVLGRDEATHSQVAGS